MDSLDITYDRGTVAAPPPGSPVGPGPAKPMDDSMTKVKGPGTAGRASRGGLRGLLRRWRRGLLAMTILAAGIGGMIGLVATKPDVVREAKPERMWSVDTVSTTRADHRPEIQLLGTVVAGRSADLRALVGGTVAEVSPALRDGGRVRAGEPLLRIESLDYELVVAELRAALDEARAAQDAAVAERGTVAQELERASALAGRQALAQARVDDLRLSLQAADARVRQREAGVERLQAQLRKAETDLARTVLTAPFDAFVGQTNAEVGMRLSSADRVAQLSGAEGLEARVNLPTDAYGRLIADGQGVVGRQAMVHWTLGETRLQFPARITRVTDRIDTATGGVTVFVELEGNFLDQPLRPGAFVEVVVPDQLYAGVVKLPVTALHGDDRVYVVDGESRLKPVTVDVAARTSDQVFIASGLEPGSAVVTTRFQEIGPGLKVTVRGSDGPVGDLPQAAENPGTDGAGGEGTP